MDDSLLDRLKRFDEMRDSLPAEHWLTFGAALWFLTRHPPSSFSRLLSIAAGLALVYRGASGRDGPAAWWMTKWRDKARRARRLATGRYIDTMEPYSKRVRVSAISEPIGSTALSR